MKKIGFLSFGHYQAVPGSQVRTAREALLQTIELAVAAEEIGIDGAFIRVHHFAPQLASPFPLLAAMAARTTRIDVGTAVIDMRYENPLYMAEEAAAVDLISSERLQLGVSRGSPETALRGFESFGYESPDPDDEARAKTALFRAALSGAPVAQSDPQMTGQSIGLAIQPHSDGLENRIWWGSGSIETARWAGEQGMNLMSSTLLFGDTGAQFGDLQAEQIRAFKEAWADSGWDRQPRVSVSRSILPITTDQDREYFGPRASQDSQDQVGHIDGGIARFGKSYVGDPDKIVEDLVKDAAVMEADNVLLTVPNQLGVDYNAHLLETIAKEIAPSIGWIPLHDRAAQS